MCGGASWFASAIAAGFFGSMVWFLGTGLLLFVDESRRES